MPIPILTKRYSSENDTKILSDFSKLGHFNRLEWL